VASPSTEQITGMLLRWSQGDEHALDSLVPLVYKDVRRIAAYLMKGERRGHSLQPTEVANELYIKLKDEKKMEWQNRDHFLAVAARAMRQILVDHARKRGRRKRGGEIIFTTLKEAVAAVGRPFEALDLDWALDRLAAEHPRKARVVELKVYGGLTHDQIARLLGVSTITVQRDWDLAVALLRSYMQERDSDG
jgi:RNA polymerase sigma-70 factor (ECF subfamily)